MLERRDDYASNAKANTAITLASVLGGIGTLGAIQGNCGNGGLLNGILGGGNRCGEVSALMAENAMLKANNVTDAKILDAYKQSNADNKALQAELYAFIKPLAEEAANNRVNIATLQAKLDCCCEKQDLREQIILGKVNEVALMANNGLTALQGTVNCLQQTVSGITKTIVPTSAICPQPMPLYNTWVAPTSDAPTSVNVANATAVQRV